MVDQAFHIAATGRPGPVYLDLPKDVQVGLDKDCRVQANREKYESRVPLHRIGAVEEVANVAVFLASDRASYMTGATVDGGWQVPGLSPADLENNFGLQLLGTFLFLLSLSPFTTAMAVTGTDLRLHLPCGSTVISSRPC